MNDSLARVIDSLGPIGTAAAVAGIAVLAVLLVGLVLHRRRSEAPASPPEGAESPPATLGEPAVGIIRRPLYVDPMLLDDLLAHAETRDYGRRLRDELDDAPAATAETRKLNKVLAGLEQRRMLIDLDASPAAPLAKGSAVSVTGRLEELPVSAVAELLELSTPVLVHSTRSSDRSSDNGDGGTRERSVPDAAWGTGPKIFTLQPTTGDRRYLLILHPDGARDEVRRPLTEGEVTVLGVTEDVLGKRDTIDVDDYLTPYLSRDVQERVRDTDLKQAVESVASLAGRKVRKRDLTFEGPGARMSVAAIHR